MDPRKNPYAPGAGAPPPELAGRDQILEDARIALDRIRGGLAAKSAILIGLRGVGKTVLLNRMRMNAEADKHFALWMEAPEDRSLPGILGTSAKDGAPAARQTPRRCRGRQACAEGARRFHLGYEDQVRRCRSFA